MAERRTVSSARDLQEFNAEAVQQVFKSSYDAGTLRDTLWEHWCRYVPAVYKVALETVDPAREERKARRLLFRPMEAFLCQGEPDSVFRQLKDLDTPPQICGHVFKTGEPNYSCRDCGMDPTCVLCIECFQQSVHRKHRYKMSTSGGGGYCDCGDMEAWKEEPFCGVHRRGYEKQQQDEDPVAKLPEDFQQRARTLFSIVMDYATQLLLWQHCDVLPPGLQPDHMDNFYATMLYNDEVHTYEQVINTLQRAVDCTQKEAVDFATTVDREGRSCVKVGTFADCEKARNVIERNTSRHGGKALKVVVMHQSVVSHHIFAQRIFPWIHSVISHSAGLRQLFCKLSMEGETEMSIVEKLMLADTQLWKGARILSQKLCMAGVLMDPECKKQFAVLFTRIYPQMVAGFIDDDHDHSVCVVSQSVQIYTVPTLHYGELMAEFVKDDHFRSVSMTKIAVQIFTVPTLARALIMEHNLLQVILRTFLDICEAKKNRDGKFAFERNDRSQSFRRAQYMLYDVKYVLTCKPLPGDWNTDLKCNFLHGFDALLELLRCMQGMDAVQRQTGQHIEFEPEWEGAFNLQLKLADVIAAVIEWCSTDRDVLLEAVTRTVETLFTLREPGDINKDEKSLAGQTATCIRYDVASQPVSLHLPVSRLLAGMFPHMNRLGCMHRDIVRGWKLTAPQLVDPCLRALVLVAQNHAGMWRRNGYALLNQIYFYQNVRCRTEMFDKDITMLQVGASLIPPNDFLIQLLDKFGLLAWAGEDFDASTLDEVMPRQIITLAEEFLTLIIYILSERYEMGVGCVTEQDSIKREIVHQLCIQPMAHSELSKALPEDPNHETGIEDVVNEVAIFKKPTGSEGKGMYELKPECYMMYNPYFYHYSRADQSKSEEAQRKRKANKNEDQALPPPVAPPFLGEFSNILNLLHCDIMAHLLNLILTRTESSRSSCWSELQFEKVLHIIGIALHEEKQAHKGGDDSFKFIVQATSGSPSIIDRLERLVGNVNISHEAQKDLLTWTLKTMREVRQLRDDSLPMDTAMDEKEAAISSKAEQEKKRKSELAAKRRARIMQQMSEMQKSFIRNNAKFFEEINSELIPPSSDPDPETMDTGEPSLPIVIGSKQTACSSATIERKTCILCQEEQDITHQEKAMVLAGFIQRSTVLSHDRGKIIENAEEHDPLFMPHKLIEGVHTSTCGHVMHGKCWQRFYDAIVQRERRRTLRFRQHFTYDIEKHEYLCPLCETVSNTVIPLVPSIASLVKDGHKKAVELSLKDWLDGIQKTVRASIKEAKDKESEEEAFLFVPCPLSTITKMMAESVAKNFQYLFEYVYLDESETFSDSMLEMLRKFSTDAYAFGLGVNPDEDNIRVPIMAWSTCAYTIMTTEQCLRDEGKPLFGALPSRQNDCLSAIVKFAAVCNQVIQHDIVKKHCVNLLSALVLERDAHRLMEVPSVMEMDMFHYLVMLCLALPALYAEDEGSTCSSHALLARLPTGSLNDHHSLKLALTAHIVQILLSADFTEESMETETSDADSDAMLHFYLQLLKYAGVLCASQPSGYTIKKYTERAVMPFLRCCALFFHYLTDVKNPVMLTAVGMMEDEQFDVLCHYLDIPAKLSQLLDFSADPVLVSLIKNWCENESVKQRLMSASREKEVLFPLSVNHLVPLPGDYSEIINRVSTFTCPKSEGDDSRAPTMCLVCGEMLCSQSYCCQTELSGSTVGAATAHAHYCGAGTGMFLRVRECQVLLLSGQTKGCFFPPPYLDEYGETDQGLRRGNPLHLCPDRYHKLQKLWLRHCIPEEIAHSLESNSNLLSIDWQHL